ncbi:MAG: hemagglutinin [Prochlorococcus marinus CUG1439]|uniref:hemagglutinin n=1 Tax=Prochlorococcus sp. MIT 1314 TaxID=3096220 RepID=UPI001B226354|nr:hemagglutinin [Prochlorococcus sp. MIT 1314]MCR8538966.1 hemagglutinin [Prochlorococcus marinus CUG1439]
MELKFCPATIFRETPKVTFFDAGILSSNGCDVVMHSGAAVSPPDQIEDEHYYMHNHQIDHNLVITGERKFILINPNWDEPHHVIYLKRSMGALEIPAGTYHRSISGKEGSIVLNQPIRDELFDSKKEFVPQKLKTLSLINARKSPPVYWIWENDQIKRLMFNPLGKRTAKAS